MCPYEHLHFHGSCIHAEGLLGEFPLQCGRYVLSWIHHPPGNGPLPAILALDGAHLKIPKSCALIPHNFPTFRPLPACHDGISGVIWSPTTQKSPPDDSCPSNGILHLSPWRDLTMVSPRYGAIRRKPVGSPGMVSSTSSRHPQQDSAELYFLDTPHSGTFCDAGVSLQELLADLCWPSLHLNFLEFPGQNSVTFGKNSDRSAAGSPLRCTNPGSFENLSISEGVEDQEDPQLLGRDLAVQLGDTQSYLEVAVLGPFSVFPKRPSMISGQDHCCITHVDICKELTNEGVNVGNCCVVMSADLCSKIPGNGSKWEGNVETLDIMASTNVHKWIPRHIGQIVRLVTHIGTSKLPHWVVIEEFSGNSEGYVRFV
uniref:Uncharacterized protein n=1 Tax=Lutzomyia longipalpis TaxID=7200 RepID=A0A1B0C9E6_LUTLO